MKKFSLAIAFGITLAVSASAQVKSNQAANNHPNVPRTAATAPVATETRARYSQPNTNTQPSGVPQPVRSGSPAQQWGNASVSNTVTSIGISTPVSRSATVTPAPNASLTQTYRVGKGDILDIQIPYSLSSRSTLYTVSETGVIDYPLASGPIQVVGLTPEAIAARLKANIRVIDAPISVKVRDYASHSVNVIGFVQTPGSKVLRREAVPLYVVLAEATPLKEATSVTVMRNGMNVALIDLHNIAASNQLIFHGDIIKVSDRAVGSK